MSITIKITGASGYLGKIISGELHKKGYAVSGVNRKLLYGPAERLGDTIKNATVLINLAGAPVLQRWTARNKKEIYESRVLTAENLVRAIKILPPGKRPQRVISASAVGVYMPGHTHSETSQDFNTGFLGRVVTHWEATWNNLPENIPLTIFRIAVVLGKESATIKKMLLPFKSGLGGRIGNGKQPFPFVHENDVASAFTWAAESPGSNGVYNLAAPHLITNAEFTRAFAQTLHRPAILPVPPLALRMLFGKAATMLTESPAVIPDALKAKDFHFQYPTIETTLQEILK